MKDKLLMCLVLLAIFYFVYSMLPIVFWFLVGVFCFGVIGNLILLVWLFFTNPIDPKED